MGMMRRIVTIPRAGGVVRGVCALAAALMLAQSTLSIADVALEVGYLNSANFSTEFKKFWQKSPTQLRSECQADPQVLQNLVASKFQ